MHNPESSLVGGKAGSQLRKVLLLLLGCPGCKLRSSATEAQGTRRRLWRGQERASTGPSAQQAAAGSGEVGQVLGHELATRALGQAAHEHDGDGRRQGQHHGHRKCAVPAWQRTNPPWACLHAVEQEISPSMQSTITPPRRASAVWPIFQNSKGAILTCDSKACALKRTAAGLQTLLRVEAVAKHLQQQKRVQHPGHPCNASHLRARQPMRPVRACAWPCHALLWVSAPCAVPCSLHAGWHARTLQAFD